MAISIDWIVYAMRNDSFLIDAYVCRLGKSLQTGKRGKIEFEWKPPTLDTHFFLWQYLSSQTSEERPLTPPSHWSLQNFVWWVLVWLKFKIELSVTRLVVVEFQTFVCTGRTLFLSRVYWRWSQSVEAVIYHGFYNCIVDTPSPAMVQHHATRYSVPWKLNLC